LSLQLAVLVIRLSFLFSYFQSYFLVYCITPFTIRLLEYRYVFINTARHLFSNSGESLYTKEL
jgi:hypothetical protein